MTTPRHTTTLDRKQDTRKSSKARGNPTKAMRPRVGGGCRDWESGLTGPSVAPRLPCDPLALHLKGKILDHWRPALRIRDVRTIPLEYPLPQPVFDANYIMATKPALLVEVETDEGLIGLGESAHFGGPLRST